MLGVPASGLATKSTAIDGHWPVSIGMFLVGTGAIELCKNMTEQIVPAALVLAGIAYFLASKQGFAIGVLSFVLAAVALQLCYFLSAAITIFMDNIKPAKAPSEEFL
jgi:hypothetical protein